ncbi:hypothetical protein [Devosia sp. SL43]|uniref:hypothetical protein n=1 Tax=Devosia sp. SL43 TaxID=2806348 RepID=UPI003017B2C8|nr:hypothetical protein IM737_20505 [Devosia sp. SL43]
MGFITNGKDHQVILADIALRSPIPTHVDHMRRAKDLHGAPVFLTSEADEVHASNGHFG